MRVHVEEWSPGIAADRPQEPAGPVAGATEGASPAGRMAAASRFEDEHPWPYRPIALGLMIASASVTIVLLYAGWRGLGLLIAG